MGQMQTLNTQNRKIATGVVNLKFELSASLPSCSNEHIFGGAFVIQQISYGIIGMIPGICALGVSLAQISQ
jgi:hypothetical protein